MEIEEMRLLARFLANELHSMHDADMAPKWENGKVIVMPGDPSMKEYEMPIERLMHKIVMMRDNLRVLEQQINSNKELSDGEKVKLQSYITRIYGSMTSFNFLFYSEQDKFNSKA